MSGFGRTAIVANGEVFADALVVGAFAARGGHPILLTSPEGLSSGVHLGLRYQWDVEHIVVMGGTAAISEEIKESITDLGLPVTRLAGATRYDPAIEAARFVRNRYSDAAGQECCTTRRIGVARARVPFDSFSAGPLLARLCVPLLLADPAVGQRPPPYISTRFDFMPPQAVSLSRCTSSAARPRCQPPRCRTTWHENAEPDTGEPGTGKPSQSGSTRGIAMRCSRHMRPSSTVRSPTGATPAMWRTALREPSVGNSATA
ncbi:cell wall-binding repeat-containing protein [Candidatus Poriferisodalis sp.]|uniref:cell wall-binding repeat-containing protein n=1 Tax=Candidatus Poriferisodalis sp. TaxID=3101277 RepID=UPI003AF51CB7